MARQINRKGLNRKVLIKKLDKIVSQIVIARDKHCVVCGSVYRLTNGHMFSRGAYSTRWDLENCFAQCWSCNFRHEFDPYPFINWYIKKFGQEKLDALHVKYRTIRKWKDFELAQLYQELADGTC